MAKHAAHDPGEALDDAGYEGPAELLVDGRSVPVDVKLVGHFSPVAGRFHWYGRVAASPRLAELLARPLVLRTPFGEAETTLHDVDPWGRPRVAGYGMPPFELLDDVPR